MLFDDNDDDDLMLFDDNVFIVFHEQAKLFTVQTVCCDVIIAMKSQSTL